MASPAVRVGTGSTVTFGTSAWSAQITSMKWGSITRKAVDSTHLGTAAPAGGKFGNATFIAGDISDPGELTLEGHFNPDNLPPIDAVAETITVTVKGSTTPATWVGTGFVTSFELGIPLEDKMTYTMAVKFSGNITKTSGT